MITDAQPDVEVQQMPDAVADAWAAVFIDVYEKLKPRGELPEGDATGEAEEGPTL